MFIFFVFHGRFDPLSILHSNPNVIIFIDLNLLNFLNLMFQLDDFFLFVLIDIQYLLFSPFTIVQHLLQQFDFSFALNPNFMLLF